MSSDRWRNSFERQVSKALIERINSAKREIKKVTPGRERTWSYYLLLSSLRKNDPTMSSNATFSARATFFLPCLSLPLPPSLSLSRYSSHFPSFLQRCFAFSTKNFKKGSAASGFPKRCRRGGQMIPLLKCTIHVLSLLLYISYPFDFA